MYGGVLVKSTTHRECDATAFVNSIDSLNVPVPRVVDIITIPRLIRAYFNCCNIGDNEGSVLLLMTTLPGKPLGSALNEFSELQQQHLITQLSQFFGSIRAISQPSNMVCGIGGRGCASYIMSLDTFGPFDSVPSFNAWMSLRAQSRLGLERAASLPERIDTAETRFTHGDLTPFNILVDEEGNVTGVIDWESAGWMPRHWDPALVSYSISK
ncbi:aminoglycoside phosphotransferase [Calocera cornea HHB12733]|uniref:Aminoglycoside phosphotransferase n=1 Tax=Calocera cornea HHB12733 TaxID=1353952 RepID=A0A165F6D2_9BASI|nr:aminoglycoside phosphotransferase [Calocera cornea HHB12733]